MKRIAALLLLAAVSYAAQENKNAQSKPPASSDAAANGTADEHPARRTASVEKLFVLKYADPGPVINLVRALGGIGSENAQLRAIAVTAEPHAMGVIEDAIKQLDVPSAAPRNIELTVYLVVGTDAEGGVGNPVPKELESVVTQIRSAFPFKNYRQLDVVEARTRTGEKLHTSSDGGKVDGTAGGTVFINVDIQSVGLAQDGATVRLDHMDATIFWPEMHNPLSVRTSVDVGEGQKVVVGRIGVSHDQALFVVLTAHVVR